MKKKTDVIKMMIASVVLILIVVSMMFVCDRIERTYSMTGFVVEKHGNVVTVKDSGEKEWVCYSLEDVLEGDEVKIIFNNNMTHETREDDNVIKIKNA